MYIFRGGDNISQKSHSSSGGGGYQVMTNGHSGHSGGVSPNSSQLSMDNGSTLITRTQKQHVSHNVSYPPSPSPYMVYLYPIVNMHLSKFNITFSKDELHEFK